VKSWEEQEEAKAMMASSHILGEVGYTTKAWVINKKIQDKVNSFERWI